MISLPPGPERLLGHARAAIAACLPREEKWTMGGGTALMLFLDHRGSRDIDIFFQDAQALGYLSPRVSDATARLTRDYEETSTSVKLRLEDGEIDFIVAGDVYPAAASRIPVTLGGAASRLRPRRK